MFIELVAIFASLLVPTVEHFLSDKQPDDTIEMEEEVETPYESRIRQEIRLHEHTKSLLDESRQNEQELKSRIEVLQDKIALTSGGRSSTTIKFCEERAKNYLLELRNAELERGIEEAFELTGAERNPIAPLVTDLHAMVQNLVE